MAELSTRERIIEAADLLFYQKGFEYTSFKHIADVVQISRGNFYHHFKTKDDILSAVIEYRMENTRVMLDEWQEKGTTATDRIRCFIRILIMNQAKIKLYGCPVGTLSSELTKLNHEAKTDANKLFTMFREWLRKQFVLLGHKQEADDLAMHLLARSQGVATLAQAFQDEAFIAQEVKKLCEWLSAYTNEKIH